jgi:hypothetical protein
VGRWGEARNERQRFKGKTKRPNTAKNHKKQENDDGLERGLFFVIFKGRDDD